MATRASNGGVCSVAKLYWAQHRQGSSLEIVRPIGSFYFAYQVVPERGDPRNDRGRGNAGVITRSLNLRGAAKGRVVGGG